MEFCPRGTYYVYRARRKEIKIIYHKNFYSHIYANKPENHIFNAAEAPNVSFTVNFLNIFRHRVDK